MKESNHYINLIYIYTNNYI